MNLPEGCHSHFGIRKTFTIFLLKMISTVNQEMVKKIKKNKYENAPVTVVYRFYEINPIAI